MKMKERKMKRPKRKIGRFMWSMVGMSAVKSSPSAENAQPWMFVVVRDAGRRAAIADLTRAAKHVAGTGDPTGDFLELSYDEWRQVIDTNLSGAFLCSQRAARRMVEGGGRIINITSVHEHIPRTGASAYCASKGGLGLLTKVMAMELAEYGITVNAIAPGEIATPMTGAEDEDPGTIERPNLPLGRPGHAREISAWVAFLASEKASYATGASFVVDGGLMLMAAELAS
jgi:NAD(P)-dependent dehydrogenase (short-subunit alcohol dehydrogenase family)